MSRRRLLWAGVVAAAVAVSVFAMSSPASAHTSTFRNVATLRCLDSNTSGSVYTLGCNGGNFQKWTPTNVGGSTWTIRNLATGRCLDSNTSGSVYTLGCNGGSFQKWVLSSGSPYQLRNLATGRCLDSNTAGRVYTLACNGGNFQRWYH